MNTKPQWVLDQERYEEQMGPPPPTGATAGDLALFGLALSWDVITFVVLAIVLYLVGRAVVG